MGRHAPNSLYCGNRLTATGVPKLARSTVTDAISYQDIKAVYSKPLSVTHHANLNRLTGSMLS